MDDFSIIELFLQASLVVQAVMVILLMVSIISWIVIFERYFNLNRIKEANKLFEEQFWSGKDLHEIYIGIEEQSNEELVGSLRVFKSGFGEFLRLSDGQQITIEDLESVNRAIRVSLAREEESLMHHLPFLANAGSVSPYVGLFGTVWGIINSFQGLSDATQATINAVAPGISEALVATALGLFAAIPAVVAYNRFASESDTQLQQSSIFGEELASILYRQTVKAKILIYRIGKRKKLNAEINVVPYIDVMLVLLIIFMVLSPLLIQGIEVNLPKTDTTKMSIASEPLVISIDELGEYYINLGEEQLPISLMELKNKAKIIFQANPDIEIVFKSDANVPFDFVAKGMASIQSLGIEKVGIITSGYDS